MQTNDARQIHARTFAQLPPRNGELKPLDNLEAYNRVHDIAGAALRPLQGVGRWGFLGKRL